MDERTYTINELKSLISESAADFKAKIGNGVNSANKKENNATYSSAKKRVNDFDGGGSEIVEERNLPEKEDGNRTTLDYAIDGAPDEAFRDKVKAQAEGYTSTLEKNNGIEKVGEFSDKTYQQFKDAGEKIAKNVEDMKKRGLMARGASSDAFKKDSLYKESKKIAVLNFKSTTFLNESQMIAKIPDDYKVDGNRFKVKDAGENEFIVEWADGEANILSYENKKKLNESKNKFFHLMGYNSKDYVKNSTTTSRLAESTEFRNVLEKVRESIKNNK
jgi:hypothetical protein